MNMAQFNGPTELYHNSFNQWKIFDMSNNVVMFPNEGVQKYERNGDEIYGKGFMIRGSFGFAGDRRGTTLRFYLVKPKNVNTTLAYNTMFDNITGNVALDPLDKNEISSTQFLGTYKIPDRSAPTMSVDGTNELIDSNLIFKKWIPYVKKIKFQHALANTPSNCDNSMSLVVTAYDHNSALQTDICIKEMDLMCSFYYSDP